jgi:S-disulfanyl-L-cysteine oxidoreductase SoxD
MRPTDPDRAYVHIAVAQGTDTTVWQGVYTAEQAERGRKSYERRCEKCHRADLSGDGALQGDGSEVVPVLVGASFATRWNGLTVADLFLAISNAMPWDAPGTVSPEANIAIVSYLLEKNQIPSGEAALPADTEKLAKILITSKP